MAPEGSRSWRFTPGHEEACSPTERTDRITGHYRIDLPNGSFTTKLAASRVTYTMTPLMFASTLV
jgi:hypothetical protein